MARESLVIIGNGMAAARLVQGLTAATPDRYAISVVGDEPGFAYNRILLSSVLAGDALPAELALKPAEWWRDSGVRIRSGLAKAIDRNRREIELADGRRFPFSKLVFATGSRALRLPLRGAHLPQIFVFRTLDDVARLIALAERKARVAVIGGGLLGIEAACGIAKRGGRVTLVHLMDRLMERQLDAGAAAIVKASLERQGISVLLEAQSRAVLGKTEVVGLELADGRMVACDAVIMAAGITPNSELARDAGFVVNRGIVVNAKLETNVPDVYAMGECAEVEGQCCGLVEPAYAQADTLARRLAGDDDASYSLPVQATNLKVSGLPVFSAGNFLGGEGTSRILLRDLGLGLYKKFVIRNGVVEGAVLVGDTSESAWYLKLIRGRTAIAPFRSGLAFGEAYCRAAAGEIEKQAA